MKNQLNLSSILTVERVAFITTPTKEELLKQMVALLSTAKEVHNKDELLTQIFHREELMSTGIGLGIGVPHTRIDSIDDLVIAFGVCRNAVTDYQSLDNKPVELVVMIAANTSQHSKHISALSSITRVLKDERTYQAIVAATTPEEVYVLLTGEK